MRNGEAPLVLARLEEQTARSAGRALLETFGRGPGPDPECRWHAPGFVSLRSRKPVDEALLAQARALPGVKEILSVEAPLHQGGGPFSTLGEVRLAHGTVLGGGEVIVIAGPCACESEAQVMEAAKIAAEAGAKMLRGGVFKGRTSPFTFGGLGEQGLAYLARARERTGLPVVTEALDATQLDLVAAYADMFQIGSRNMQNFPLLFEAGAHSSGIPVLLKRGLASTLDEFLQAAEYVLLGRLYAGRREAGLVLCERGIRTFEQATRFTLDVGAIPALQERCRLPVIADPSHAAGKRSLVPPLARAAVAAGAAGLLVEIHPDPDHAWSDGAQALDPAAFRALMRDLERFIGPRAGRSD